MAGWWAEIAQVVAPTTAALVITGGTPTVTIDQNRIVVPTPAELTLTGGTPVVTATDHQTVTPTAASLTLTGGTPTVAVGVTVAPTGAALTITGGTPTVLTPRLVTPTGASLTITGGTPSLGLTLRPTGASLTITGGTPTVTVASSQPTIVGVNVNIGSSVTIPAHLAGDDIELYVYNGSGIAAPVKPSAALTVPDFTYTDNPGGANTNSSATARFTAIAPTTTSGTWTNATHMIAVVLRGQAASPVGGHAESGSASATAVISPAITMTRTDGTSVLLEFGGHKSTVTALAAAPAGYTRRIASSDFQVFLNTKDVTTSDGAVTQPVTASTANGYRGATVEILAP